MKVYEITPQLQQKEGQIREKMEWDKEKITGGEKSSKENEQNTTIISWH
jgi:hypothetical protein